MTLTIELAPEVEKRLEAEARRRGQRVEEFARTVLERAVPESDLYAGLTRKTPEDFRRLAEAQGVSPVSQFEDLVGDFWPEGEDLDDFSKAVKELRSEGGGGFPADEVTAERGT